MNCFVILRKDGSFTRIEDAPKNECGFFNVALEKVQPLISIHSMFDYVRMSYEHIQEIRRGFEQCEQRMEKPLSPQKTMLAEKACRDYLYHYMAYIDNLNAFVKKAYGRNVPLTKKIEAQLNRMERIPA